VLSTEFNNATSYHADIPMSTKNGMKKPLFSGIQFSELPLKILMYPEYRLLYQSGLTRRT